MAFLKGLPVERAAAAMHWCIRVDFPEPEMPVSTVRRPRGMETSMSLRLLAWQPASLRRLWFFGTSRRSPRIGWTMGLVRAW